MKNLLIVIMFLFLNNIASGQSKPVLNKGRNINITLTPLRNCKVYLGSFYGSQKARVLVDSTYLDDKSHGTFKGPTKYTSGIYFVVSPQLTIQFELLMDAKQNFSIIADTSLKEKVNIIGSVDNDLYKQYLLFMNDKGPKKAALESRYPSVSTKSDSSQLSTEIIKLDKEIKEYQTNLIKTHPGSLLSMLLNALVRPTVPAIPIIKGKPDSSYPYRFVKEHYWDNVMFNDDRLLRTPFFEPKLDDYFRNFVSPEPDSIISEVKYILLFARTGKEIYPFLLTKFTNKYMTPEFMGQDKVFVYLFENFYAKGDTILLNAGSRKVITERAYSLMANQIGQMAPPLNLVDTTGKTKPLYNLSGRFTIVAFWDPNCGHCKEEIPKLDSFYKAKWQKYDVSVYSVNIYDNNIVTWKRFLTEKKISSDWVEVYETKEAKSSGEKAGIPNYRQLYDIYKTPTIYLLDKDKHIIAKQLSLEQFDNLIETKRKLGK